MGILSALGLMTVAEHERVASTQEYQWQDLLRRREDDITDLYKQTDAKDRRIQVLNALIANLQPDAIAMRKKRARDVEQKRLKRVQKKVAVKS